MWILLEQGVDMIKVRTLEDDRCPKLTPVTRPSLRALLVRSDGYCVSIMMNQISMIPNMPTQDPSRVFRR
jgi:hypothetical protein